MGTDQIAQIVTFPHEVRLLHHGKCTGRLFLFTEVLEAGNFYQCSCGKMWPLAPTVELVKQVMA